MAGTMRARRARRAASGPRIGAPELTARGWTLVGAAAGLLVATPILRVVALAALGLAGAALLALGYGWVRRRRALVELDRIAHPPRFTVGHEGRVVLHGRALATTPWLTLTESIDGGRRAARFVLVPLAAGTSVQAGYRVGTERRGRRIMGPALLTIADPCGLVRQSWAVTPATEILVRPRVHDIVPPRRGGGGEPAERANGPRVPVAESLGEFLGLREYEPGDDPRRVHWSSSARQGELLVRIDDAPAPGRTVVLLDARVEVHDETSFEVAVEAVASIASALRRTHQTVEVVTTGGETMRPGGRSGLDAILDRLAVLEPEPTNHLASVTAALRHRAGLGGVVMITGAADETIVDVAAALRGRRVVTLVVTRPSVARTGPIPVVDAASQPFPQAWNRALATGIRWHPANFPSRSRSPR
jgi:uncharacterized protein (DUF58 family)